MCLASALPLLARVDDELKVGRDLLERLGFFVMEGVLWLFLRGEIVSGWVLLEVIFSKRRGIARADRTDFSCQIEFEYMFHRRGAV